MEGSDVVVVRKKNFNRQKPRAETQKIIVVFFGVCTGVVMWLALDFRDESILVHTKSSSNDDTVIAIFNNTEILQFLLFFIRGKKSEEIGKYLKFSRQKFFKWML